MTHETRRVPDDPNNNPSIVIPSGMSVTLYWQQSDFVPTITETLTAPVTAELSRLSSELAAIDTAVPRRGESPDVPLVERVVQAVVQMQYDDARCKGWEAEAADCRAELSRLSEAQRRAVRERDEWKNAIIDAAVVDWIYTTEHETNPRKAVNDLLCWQTHLALDPAVSEEAATLHAEIARLSEAQEALRDLVDSLEIADHLEDVRMWKSFNTACTVLARLTAAPLFATEEGCA